MKVLHITTNYSGGAGIACRRLHIALLEKGIDSKVLVLRKVEGIDDERILRLEEIMSAKSGRLWFKVLDIMNRVFNKLSTTTDAKAFINGPNALFQIQKTQAFQEADVIHLHWVPKMLNYATVFSNKSKRFVWTLHDMNPFTGGNHYETDYDYERFDHILKRNLRLKQGYLAGTNLKIISPSHWLGQKAAQSSVMGSFLVHIIPNPIPIDVFRPLDKQACRKELGVPAGKHIILFVSENIDDKRKGFRLLVDAIAALKNPERYALLVIGKAFHFTGIEMEVLHLGYVHEANKMAQAYQAADVFIIPSLEDNLPNTVLESLSCGTPVIGFDIGGIPDMVKEGVTGYLANPKKLGDLSHQINRFFEVAPTIDFSGPCRQFILEHFSPELVASQMIDVYRSFE